MGMPLEGLDALYQEIVLDHYRSPRNHQLLQDPNLKGEGFNPFCGDRVILTAKVSDSGHISEVGFIGEGCAISQASASMMSELLKDHTVKEAEALVSQFRGIMQGKALTEEEEEKLGDLAALEGVKKFPIRIKCALLAWVTLQDAIEEYDRQPGRAPDP